MQGFKKVLVALLVVATILGTIGPVFAAPADVAGTKYEDAAVRLLALGIFKGDDKGNFNPDQPITRAEATAIVIRALGLEKSADLMKGVTKFADVNADPGLQWATGAINIAVSNGIINGYPNGQFGGRDNVTYAQLAKMVLYALNYGVTVEGGIWPTAVLAKADDLGMLDNLSVVADAPITRGDAAKLLDNSLDIKSLKQTGYGDLKQYEETGATMLEKMNLDEIEGRVVEIPAVASGLDDNEVTIDITKKNGEDLKDIDTETYTQLEGVDVQGLFGLEVKAWVNDDDEVVFVEKKTSDNDIYTDTISELTDKDTVKLDVLDDEVTFADDAVVYVNYSKKSVTDATKDLKVGYYGRFVEKNNKIAFASLFAFGGNEGVVTSVDGEKIKYFTTSENERTLDLTDADSVTVYNADLTKSSLDKIEKDNVISWWKDGDDWYIVVSTAQAEGKLEKVKSDKVTIDGKDYTMQKADNATYSLDDDETVEAWTEAAGDLDDLDGEDVVALLNLKGHVRHLRGSATKTSGTQYGIVTASPSDSEITVFTKDGEEVTYSIDKKTDWGVLRDPVSGRYYGKNDSLGYYVLSYKLNADSEITESKDGVGVQYAVSVSKALPTVPDDVYELTSNPKADVGSVVKKEKDDDFVLLDGSKKYYIDSNTVVMRAVNSKGELDPEVLAWEDFKDLVLGDSAANDAIIFGDVGKDAKAIIFVNANFKGTSEDWYYGVVTDKPWKSGGDWHAEIDVFGEGTQEYTLADSPTDVFSKGDLVKFQLTAKGEADITSSDVVKISGTPVEVTSADDLYIEVSGATYKVEKDAVVYDLDNDGALDDKLGASDIEKGDKIFFIEKAGVVKAAVIAEKGTGTTTPPTSGYKMEYNGQDGMITVTKDGESVEDDKYYVLVGEEVFLVTDGKADVSSLPNNKLYTGKLVDKANLTDVLYTLTFVEVK
ncbi:MAG TPA: S-layer homology domain-containing protein [Thermoanaerobacterium sp.]|nr:S-layer homology domain-containing protein [Thermoanaerobacterium sp.]